MNTISTIRLGMSAAWVLAAALTAGGPAAYGGPIFDNDTARISFQALLTDDLGEPLASPTVDLSFTLYHPVIGPVEGPIDLNAVPIENGVVNVLIPFSRSSFDGMSRELGVSVNGGLEMSPRIPLAATGHSYRVDRVENPELTDDVVLGDATTAGSLQAYRDTGTASVELLGASGEIRTVDQLGQARFIADEDGTMQVLASGGALAGRMTASGDFQLNDVGSGFPSIFASGGSGILSVPTAFQLYNFITEASRGWLTDTNHGALMELFDELGNKTVELGNGIPDGGFLKLNQTNGNTGIHARGQEAGGGGKVDINNTGGVSTLRLDGDSNGNGYASVQLRNGAGNLVAQMIGGSLGGGGEVSIRDDAGTEMISLEATESLSQGAKITMKRADGTTTIEIDADDSGEGRIKTNVLEITGGADLSEQFDIRSAGSAPLPGMVVSIDADRPGELAVSSKPYDRAVAGIISGAGGVKPGMLMGQRGTAADGKYPVALTGRVYCWCDATGEAIRPGDLLTTSGVPGHAMKVCEPGRGSGAIIGKAMTGLESGRGLVLVLVNLQ